MSQLYRKLKQSHDSCVQAASTDNEHEPSYGRQVANNNSNTKKVQFLVSCWHCHCITIIIENVIVVSEANKNETRKKTQRERERKWNRKKKPSNKKAVLR